MKIKKIWLDMDGVISDFEKRYGELYKINPSTLRQDKFHPNFMHFIATKQFETLDLMPQGEHLIKYLSLLKIPTEILSSTGVKEHFRKVSLQKRTWLNKHKVPFKSTFVPGKEYKYQYAKPDAILIDDTESNVLDWRKAGGIAILHKTVQDTIKQLQSLLAHNT